MPPRQPTYDDAIRVVHMLRMLERRSSKAMAISDIAEELGLTRRSVDRYVKALAAAITTEDGEPLLRKEIRNGRAWVSLSRETSTIAAGIYQYGVPGRPA
jgi:hypothetical protein